VALLKQDILPYTGGATTEGTVPKQVPGVRTTKRLRITGSGSYTTGGYALAASDFGFNVQIDYLDIVNENPGSTAAFWFWNYSTQKLQLVIVSSGSEFGNGSNDSSAICDVLAYGY
jgi:hypothetical protein